MDHRVGAFGELALAGSPATTARATHTTARERSRARLTRRGAWVADLLS
jgi:hypothetical protein